MERPFPIEEEYKSPVEKAWEAVGFFPESDRPQFCTPWLTPGRYLLGTLELYSRISNSAEGGYAGGVVDTLRRALRAGVRSGCLGAEGQEKEIVYTMALGREVRYPEGVDPKENPEATRAVINALKMFARKMIAGEGVQAEGRRAWKLPEIRREGRRLAAQLDLLEMLIDDSVSPFETAERMTLFLEDGPELEKRLKKRYG